MANSYHTRGGELEISPTFSESAIRIRTISHAKHYYWICENMISSYNDYLPLIMPRSHASQAEIPEADEFP